MYDYARHHPRGSDVLIVCEVADSSLAYDFANRRYTQLVIVRDGEALTALGSATIAVAEILPPL